ITTDAPELAPLVLTEPARSALDATRTTRHGPVETAVQVTLRDGELVVRRQDGDLCVHRALAAVEAVRAIARRPAEIRDELAASIASLGGRVVSRPWTWETGLAATLPCGRIGTAFGLALEAGRPVVRLVSEGTTAAGWAEISGRDRARSTVAWQQSGV